MGNSAIYQTIKATVLAALPGCRIVLFGSHARGDHDRLSDYDLLIITEKTFLAQESIKWSTQLDKAIIKAVKAPVDILISSEDEVIQKSELPGHIIRTAMREGLAL